MNISTSILATRPCFHVDMKSSQMPSVIISIWPEKPLLYWLNITQVLWWWVGCSFVFPLCVQQVIAFLPRNQKRDKDVLIRERRKHVDGETGRKAWCNFVGKQFHYQFVPGVWLVFQLSVKANSRPAFSTCARWQKASAHVEKVPKYLSQSDFARVLPKHMYALKVEHSLCSGCTF